MKEPVFKAGSPTPNDVTKLPTITIITVKNRSQEQPDCAYDPYCIRTEYSILNDYRHKLGQCESGLCECGHMETVQQCQLYEEERNILYNRFREQLGIHTPNVYTLIGYEGHREISTWREQIMQEVGEYNERTERFKLR